MERRKLKPAEIMTQCRELEIVRLPDVLRYLAGQILKAQLVNGMRVLDGIDFKQFLLELAAEFEGSA